MRRGSVLYQPLWGKPSNYHAWLGHSEKCCAQKVFFTSLAISTDSLTTAPTVLATAPKRPPKKPKCIGLKS